MQNLPPLNAIDIKRKPQDSQGRLNGYQEGGTPGEQPILSTPHKWRMPEGTRKRQIIKCSTSGADLDSIDTAKALLEEMKINSPTGTDKPPTQAGHAVDNANKSAELELHLS